MMHNGYETEPLLTHYAETYNGLIMAKNRYNLPIEIALHQNIFSEKSYILRHCIAFGFCLQKRCFCPGYR
jgi:hypothetical protein